MAFEFATHLRILAQAFESFEYLEQLVNSSISSSNENSRLERADEIQVKNIKDKMC